VDRNAVVSQVELTGLSKAFGSTRALEDVSISLSRGEVHGLIGENGAGKSTLVKSLSGVVVPDAGSVALDGKPLLFGHPAAARALGIATAFQELSVLPNLTVAQNLLMPNLPRSPFGTLSAKRSGHQAAAILDDWHVEGLDPSQPVEELSLAQRQQLEITSALSRKPRLLILDEPTAALPDIKWLYRCIEALTASGAAVLYISHRMAEIKDLCARGTVLRNGRVVGTFDRASFEEDRVITMMIGRSLDMTFRPRAGKPAADDLVLSVRGLSSGTHLRGADIDVARGEIAGVAALEGHGQRELFYCVSGVEKPAQGTIVMDGKPQHIRNPRRALACGAGFALVPEERKAEGLFLDLPSRSNITLPALRRCSRFGFVSPSAERRIAGDQARRINLDPELLGRSVAALSGGNQQKVVLGRTLLSGARCLLLYDPTRGIDAGTKFEIYDLIRRFADDGGSVLLYSTEIPELVGLCDRIYVMYGGKVIKVHAGDDLTEEQIMLSAVGHRPGIAEGASQLP